MAKTPESSATAKAAADKPKRRRVQSAAAARKKPNATVEIICYMAGLIDGKGNPGAYANSENAFMLLREPEVAEFARFWGGEYREFKAPKKGTTLTGWFLTAEEELALLQATQPHIRIKTARVGKVITAIENAKGA